MTTRRTFIAGLGAAAAWPLAARAQPAKMPAVGWLGSGSLEGFAAEIAALRKGLNEAGFVEGHNLAIEFRWAEGHYDRLPALAAELVHRPVDVILASGGLLSTQAARTVTSTVPIVFTTTLDPVAAGLVASLNRPGGNATGVTFLNNELVEKQLGLLHELVPTARRFAMLANPGNQVVYEGTTKAAASTAAALGLDLWVVKAGTEREIDEAFAGLDRRPADVMLIMSDPFFTDVMGRIVTLVARRNLPAMCGLRQFAEIGGLVSYGASSPDAYHQAGLYVARILKGEKPADLPVVQASKFDLVINMKAAKALGLPVSNTMQLLADDVIE